MNKRNKKSVALATASLMLIATPVFAASSLIIPVPQYSDSALKQAKCDKDVWTKMVADYQRKAQITAAIGQEMAEMQAKAAPNAQTPKCFDLAKQEASKILGKDSFSGNAIMGFILGQLSDKAIGAACSQVDKIVLESGISSGMKEMAGIINQGQSGNVAGVIGSMGNMTGGSNVTIPSGIGNVINGVGAPTGATPPLVPAQSAPQEQSFGQRILSKINIFK